MLDHLDTALTALGALAALAQLALDAHRNCRSESKDGQEQ